MYKAWLSRIVDIFGVLVKAAMFIMIKIKLLYKLYFYHTWSCVVERFVLYSVYIYCLLRFDRNSYSTDVFKCKSAAAIIGMIVVEIID